MDTSREDDIYSVVSVNLLSENQPPNTNNQDDHEYNTADKFNKTDSRTHSQYNTLQRSFNYSNAQLKADDSRSDMYDTIGETQLSKIDFHEAKYDAVASTGILLGPGEDRSHNRTHNSDKITVSPRDYEIVNDSTRVFVDHRVNNYFDDEMYSKPQPDSQRPEKKPMNVKTNYYYQDQSDIDQKLSLPPPGRFILVQQRKKEPEYAEPFVTTTVAKKESHTRVHDTAHRGEHHYHSLEQESGSIGNQAVLNSASVTKRGKSTRLVSAKLTVPPVRKTEITMLSESTERMNDSATMNNPILHNIEHCQFDDPMYDSVPHDTVAFQPSTPTKPSLRLTSESNEMHVASAAMDNDPELLLNHDDAPEYSDPIHLTFVDNGSSGGVVKDSKMDIIFDDQMTLYA